MIVTVLFIIGGLILLYFGAEFLVRGGSSLALRFGVPPLVVGLTVVAYGTSAPECVVSIKSALQNQGDIAIGNVIGSNIFNIAIILGFAALIRPLKVTLQVLRIDAPVMIGVSALFYLFFRDNTISFTEGLIFCAGAILYTCSTILLSRRESKTDNEQYRVPGSKRISLVFIVLMIAAGLLLLIAGAQLLIKGAIDFARALHISEAVIGLTIVAAGTSLPELATSVVAGIKKQDDIAIGNIIGSNIFNILFILGCAGMIQPLAGAGISMVDIYFMIGTAVLLLPLMWSKFVLTRWEGVLLIMIYGAYLYTLWPK